MTYNLTAINATDMVSLFQTVNTGLMYGAFGYLILIAISVISFLSFYASTQDSGKSLMATFLIAFVLSLLMKAMDLVPNLAVFVTLIGAALMFAIQWKN